MTLRALWNWWNEVWFAPRPVTPVALYRIFFGLLMLQWGLLMWPNLLVFFGSKAIVSSTSATQWAQGPTLNALLLLPPDDNFLVAFFLLVMLAAACLTAGLCTRLSAFIVFVGLTSFYFRNPFVLHSGDTFLRIAAFLLFLSPCGQALSVDNLIRVAIARDPRSVGSRVHAPWAQRLLQFNVAVVYADAFWTKVVSDQWLDGLSVYYTSRLEQFQRLPVPFLFDNVWTCRLLTWYTLAIEGCMWTLVWFKEVRYYILLAAVVFHLGLDWSMNIPQFQFIMITALITFVDPADLSRLMDKLRLRLKPLFGPAVRITFCVHSMGAVKLAELTRRLNVLDAVELVEMEGESGAATENPPSLRISQADQMLSGSAALRAVAARLPLLWVVYPVLLVPGIDLLVEHWSRGMLQAQQAGS
ncbi:MAG TPA: HTTM domain-containing protein [Candidatus Obscuribacterales bacterium]